MPATGDGGNVAEPHLNEVMLASGSLLYLFFGGVAGSGIGEGEVKTFTWR